MVFIFLINGGEKTKVKKKLLTLKIVIKKTLLEKVGKKNIKITHQETTRFSLLNRKKKTQII